MNIMCCLGNYSDSPTKLFSNLAKFLDTLAKLFFPYSLDFLQENPADFFIILNDCLERDDGRLL